MKSIIRFLLKTVLYIIAFILAILCSLAGLLYYLPYTFFDEKRADHFVTRFGLNIQQMVKSIIEVMDV